MRRTFNIPDAALAFRFVQASGPGGQHVNKTATAVELRVTLQLLNLQPGVLRRLQIQQRNRINKAGELVIQAEQHRSQLNNRKAAVARLQAMLEQAHLPRKKRIATKPSRAVSRRRLEAKKQRGQTKSGRRRPSLD